MMVDLTGEESNLLFQVLEEWSHLLAPFDLDDQRCENDNFPP